MNIFEENVSIYNGVTDNTGIVRPLKSFLFSNRHADEIKAIREIKDKAERNKYKRKLPQATISGVFSPTRAKDNLQHHTKLICVDVDAKENPDIDNWMQFKKELSILPQIAYAALSVSGNGLFAILPLRYPAQHLQQFRQLQLDFKRMGIEIDSACSDITRLRCMTFDDTPIINYEAKPYEGIYIEPKPTKISLPKWNSDLDVVSSVSQCCEEIQRTGTDITSGYEEWLKVGCSLASLGEEGRTYFHICSQQNSEYSSAKTDKMFTDLLRRNYQTVNISTFFWICKQNGIHYTT